MKTCWEYIEPGDNGEVVRVRMTEAEILGIFWDYWSQKMRQRGKRGINTARCIEDWVVVNWAERVPCS